jgi:biotin carboxylase
VTRAAIEHAKAPPRVSAPHQSISRVLIADGGSFEALKAARCVGMDREAKCFAFGPRSGAPVRWSRWCAGYAAERPGAKWVEALANASREFGAQAVIAVTERGTRRLIDRRAELEAAGATLGPLPTKEDFHAAGDKGLFASRLQSAEIDQPETLLLEEAIARGVDWDAGPWIVKRRRARGGLGAQRLSSASELDRFASTAEQRAWIAQRFVEGEDVAVNAVVRRGRLVAWFTQEAIATLKPFGPQTRMRISLERTEAVELAERVLAALAWEGPACVDFRRETPTERLLCLEVNPRFGRALLCGLAAGVNLPLALLGRFEQPSAGEPVEVSYWKAAARSPWRALGSVIRGDGRVRTTLGSSLRDPAPELAAGLSRLGRMISTRKESAEDE